MGKRIRLGYIYLYDSGWLGGVYYAQNLLKALNTLEDEKKPIIDVHCLDDKAYDDLSENTHYPYLEKYLVKKVFWKRALCKFLDIIAPRLSYNISTIRLNQRDDVFYPWCNGRCTKKLIMWRPDFQEKHLPQYFEKNDIRRRDREIYFTCKRSVPIIFSSYDSKNDFYNYFPELRNSLTYVVHFAAALPDFTNIDIENVRRKFQINKRYLLCTNQFWRHKNHLFLFKAFVQAVKNGLDLQLVCTGKLEDYRNPNYIQKIHNFLHENNANNDILTLGLIDKKELLCLMKHSYAVIQPSLFEGWNTTVEECKALNKFVFLSDLPVHREQIDKNVCFFNPNDEEDLKNKLLEIVPREEYFDYSLNVKAFGEDIYRAITMSYIQN